MKILLKIHPAYNESQNIFQKFWYSVAYVSQNLYLSFLQCFDTIERAYSYVDSEDFEHPLIFIHSGVYHNEYLFVDTNVAMIGAAPGNVVDHVIIERDSESTIMFVEGAKQAYLGYITLKVSVRKTIIC